MNTNSYDPKPSEQMIPPFQGRPGEHTGPVTYGTLREIWSADYLASLGIYPDNRSSGDPIVAKTVARLYGDQR